MLGKPREVSFPSHSALQHNSFTEVGHLRELLSQGWKLALANKFWILPDDSIHCNSMDVSMAGDGKGSWLGGLIFFQRAVLLGKLNGWSWRNGGRVCLF